uniref:Predicted protein n=1 Tax=Hordeum vulgare subsp. vulgare TaxID=112509 RepID=F2EEB8_HORVV|nr:predicted protein [Hordeum vulgare subsp. vulgare]
MVAPSGGGSHANNSGCIYDMVDRAAEASQCEVAAEGVVFQVAMTRTSCCCRWTNPHGCSTYLSYDHT